MQRIRSIDLLRGLLMVLMAIDHVRVYSGIPAGGTEPGIFFTRWVTHFCAPGFAFLAGASAYLYGQKLKDRNLLSRYLFTRGVLLVILELTVIRFSWTFNFNYREFTLAGIIWMLGWCMMILSVMIRMNATLVGIAGLVIITVQQVFKFVPKAFPVSVQPAIGEIWSFFYPCGFEQQNIAILYVLIPWIGIMAAGYGFGKILLFEPGQKRKICLWVGLSSIVLFIIMGVTVILLDPGNISPGSNRLPFLLRLLNQQKYPPSQVFALMTLGPLITCIGLAENWKGWFAKVVTVFGRVPFFYYLLHIPLIHCSALVINLIREKNMHQDWYNTAPFTQVPDSHHWGLSLLYGVFIIDVVLLYFLCRWYADYKFRHPEKKWLRYI